MHCGTGWEGVQVFECKKELIQGIYPSIFRPQGSLVVGSGCGSTCLTIFLTARITIDLRFTKELLWTPASRKGWLGVGFAALVTVVYIYIWHQGLFFLFGGGGLSYHSWLMMTLRCSEVACHGSVSQSWTVLVIFHPNSNHDQHCLAWLLMRLG